MEKPTDLQALADLAIRLDALGLYDEAIVDYLTLEKISPANWQMSYNIGNVYKKLKRFKEASQSYEKSLALNPANVDALNNLVQWSD